MEEVVLKKTAQTFNISRALTILLVVLGLVLGYLGRMWHESYWEGTLVPIAHLERSYFPRDKFVVKNQGKGFILTRKEEKCK